MAYDTADVALCNGVIYHYPVGSRMQGKFRTTNAIHSGIYKRATPCARRPCAPARFTSGEGGRGVKVRKQIQEPGHWQT
eukprot:2181257-Pyramimonas_sp.AAC.1